MAALDHRWCRDGLSCVSGCDRWRPPLTFPVLPVLMMPTKSDHGMRDGWRVGWILPRLMLAVMVMDVALHFVPLEKFAFRPNEALQRLHGMPEGPFEPNREYHNARSYGDLAALGNLPQRRLYRRVDFHTDAFGFHNPEATAGLEPERIRMEVHTDAFGFHNPEATAGLGPAGIL